MKVLVTGGAGSIGLEVVRKLLDEGHEVTILDLAEQIERSVIPEDAKVFKGSILDSVAIHHALQGNDYVVHLAARLGVKRTEVERLSCLHININGMVNILDAAVKERVEKILFSSSSEVYGNQAKMPITEESALNPVSVYAVTKLAGEEYLKAYKRQYGLDYTILRFFNVYGPGQVGQFVMKKFIDAVKQDKSPQIYGSGDQIRCFCHVKDAANGIVKALFAPQTSEEVINIGNDMEQITMLALAEKVIALSGKDIKPKKISFSESDRQEKREVFDRIPSIEKAKRLLDYTPQISIDEGIKELLCSENNSSDWSDYRAVKAT
ncbi:MAG: NAD-dependent epimerase/dehydratase family protein [Desulfobacterales bacterium]|jgi:UDP-glucose 4-epimerase